METKIIHISDLHICDEIVEQKVNELYILIKELASIIKEFLNIKYEIDKSIKFERASKENLDILKNKLIQLMPDVVIISGDITSFGDKKSFEIARTYINEIGVHGIKVLVTPGNHDVMSSYWLNLAMKIEHLITKTNGSIKLKLLTLFSSKAKSTLRKLTRFIEEIKNLCNSNELVDADSENGFKNFEEFINQNIKSTYAFNTAYKKNFCNIIPYNTVSKTPLFMNLGTSSLNEILIQENKISTSDIDLTNSVNILFFHHNPISSPYLNEDPLSFAYNSMPTSSSFLYDQQLKGIDLMLYGHQHQCSIIQMDYLTNTPGHFYLVGGASATIGDNCSFYEIIISDRYSGKINQYLKNKQGNFVKDAKLETSLFFECQNIEDNITLKTQKEIRNTKFKSGEATDFWSNIFKERVDEYNDKNNDNLFYFVGPRQNDLLSQTKLLKKILEAGNEVRILTNNFNLYNELNGLPPTLSEKFISLMGKNNYSWDQLKKEIDEILNKLASFYKTLSSDQKSKFNFKLAHTLLPLGARSIQNSTSDFILLRLIPQGINADEFPKIGTLFLNKRSDEALYEYYNEYIEKLWKAGELFDLETITFTPSD